MLHVVGRNSYSRLLTNINEARGGMTRQDKIKLTWLVNTAVVCLGFGLMMPAMCIDAEGGTIKGFIMAIITPGPSSYSILSRIMALI